MVVESLMTTVVPVAKWIAGLLLLTTMPAGSGSYSGYEANAGGGVVMGT